MKLHTYTNEIIDIAKANGASWDVGADMFLANVRNAGNPDRPYYAGAEIDYGALKEYVAELANSKPFWVIAYKENNKKIIELRKGEKFDEVKKLMEAAK